MSYFPHDPWRPAAACRDVDTAVFFPSRDADYGAARAVCACCPVTDDCLNYALAHPDLLGMWGGTTPRERRRLRRLRDVA
jgi:WhiB family transcriptional regulator, redox-sensing transcriptional regulator